MNNAYKLLIIGNVYDNHLIRFISHLKKINPNCKVDIFTFSIDQPIPDELLKCINSFLSIRKKNNIFTKISLVKYLYNIYKLKAFFSLIQDKTYDIVNIQYPTFIYSFIVHHLKRIANILLLTPWGSDVYRIYYIEKRLLKKLYKAADYVTGINNRFQYDYMKMFDVKLNKIQYLGLGSDLIDYIEAHKNEISTTKAKEILSVSNYYIITCGYNGSPEQNHKTIIESINKVKTLLPSNLLLFLPFTYGGNNEYKSSIKELCKEYSLKFLSFDSYLSIMDCFLLRQATDIFIHIQSTDANSATLQEYIQLEKKIINGAWLRYPHLSHDGIYPYFILKDISLLPKMIISTYHSNIKIDKEIVDRIVNNGYSKWIIKWNDFFEKYSI